MIGKGFKTCFGSCYSSNMGESPPQIYERKSNGCNFRIKGRIKRSFPPPIEIIPIFSTTKSSNEIERTSGINPLSSKRLFSNRFPSKHFVSFLPVASCWWRCLYASMCYEARRQWILLFRTRRRDESKLCHERNNDNMSNSIIDDGDGDGTVLLCSVVKTSIIKLGKTVLFLLLLSSTDGSFYFRNYHVKSARKTRVSPAVSTIFWVEQTQKQKQVYPTTKMASAILDSDSLTEIDDENELDDDENDYRVRKKQDEDDIENTIISDIDSHTEVNSEVFNDHDDRIGKKQDEKDIMAINVVLYDKISILDKPPLRNGKKQEQEEHQLNHQQYQIKLLNNNPHKNGLKKPKNITMESVPLPTNAQSYENKTFVIRESVNAGDGSLRELATKSRKRTRKPRTRFRKRWNWINRIKMRVKKATRRLKEKRERARKVRSLNIWKRRHARSFEEGIRRDVDSRPNTKVLSSLLDKVSQKSIARIPERRFAARTIQGLVNALAEEVDGLEVEVDVRSDTPLWRKQVDEIRIQFSRLGFKPFHIGGKDVVLGDNLEPTFSDSAMNLMTSMMNRTRSILQRDGNGAAPVLTCADEAFEAIDVDGSGSLDTDEIVDALSIAAASKLAPEDFTTKQQKQWIQDVASELVEMYDANGDGVMDRSEYKKLVEDMAALRTMQKKRVEQQGEGPLSGVVSSIRNVVGPVGSAVSNVTSSIIGVVSNTTGLGNITITKSAYGTNKTIVKLANQSSAEMIDIFDGNSGNTPLVGLTTTGTSPETIDVAKKTLGSIKFTGLKLDMRRLVFGAIPLVKRIIPGGPLVLEPFTVTLTGSWSRDDIQRSSLIDTGLRLLVAQVLKRRVRKFRDLTDGALFFGRKWSIFSKKAPQVEVPELTDIKFDKANRLIITGIARIQTSPEAPVVEQTFKLRTKIGTRKEGRLIRLEEPELALVIQCPKSFEKTLSNLCKSLNIEAKRPKPIYRFFPIYSPSKVDDDDGFDLGEDNCISSIFIRDGALRFEISAVLRPGRFLGSHYLAFTLPIRTFIFTLDQVKEGMASARRAKKEKREKDRVAAALAADSVSSAHGKSAGNGLVSLTRRNSSSTRKHLTSIFDNRRRDYDEELVKGKPAKSFFSRFVDGYLQADKEGGDDRESLTMAISDWFGRQLQVQEDEESGSGNITSNDKRRIAEI